MNDKEQLLIWVKEAIQAHNGSASILEIARHIWVNHEKELRQSGDLFFTWQYDMRWAACKLRKKGFLKPTKKSPVGKWELNKGGF